MRTINLALKSIRCNRLSFFIIFSQLSVCFAILIYSICAFFQQFDVLYTANEAYREQLYLSPDLLFVEDYSLSYEGISMSQLKIESLERLGLSSSEELTPEQALLHYTYMLDRNDEEFDKCHYKGKYLYADLFECLRQSGLTTETTGNVGGSQQLTVSSSGAEANINVTLFDEKMYGQLEIGTKKNTDLRSYQSTDRYFYALMYPPMSLGEEAYTLPYGVGDVLTQEVYNLSEHRMEIFQYEIVDVLTEPAYYMPQLFYSGDSRPFTTLETAFLHVQTMEYSGGLIAVKPETFDAMSYYANYNYNFTLVKPNDDLTETQYSELLDIIRDCGFNVIDLNVAETNTLNAIINFIRENCVILIASVLVVIFSIISVSILLGSQTGREYAIYKLCGADTNKIRSVSAIKWALIFIPAIVVGIVIALVYSGITEAPSNFITLSALVSGMLFAVLYIISFVMSYKTANTKYDSSELS